MVQGHVEAGGFIAGTTGGSPTVQVGISGYDGGSVLGSGEEKYLGKYHDLYFGASNVTAQFQLNGSLTPGFPATLMRLSGSKFRVTLWKEMEAKFQLRPWTNTNRIIRSFSIV